MIKGKKISVVVPVYNEEKTVAGVLLALKKGRKIDEIICVNDGSTDNSWEKVKECQDKKIRVINFVKNLGKGAAMARGVKEAKGDIVVFFDSDMTKVRAEHVYRIVKPLAEGKEQVVLATYQTGKFLGVFKEELSGERAYFRKDLLPLIDRFKNSRLGVETYLNTIFPKWKYVYIDAYHLEKFEKLSPTEASWQYIKEGVEIVMEKARIKGILSEELKNQLESLTSIRDWPTFNTALKQIKDYRVVVMMRHYINKYAKKIEHFIKENLGVN